MNLFRNSLLFAGFLAIFLGICIGAFLLLQPGAVRPRTQAAVSPAILVATRPIGPGDLMRQGDLTWRTIGASVPPADAVVRGQVSELSFVGAVSRRSFAVGQPVSEAAFLGPNDRRFLAAVLAPGDRAITISVSPSQSASGLILPDDRVDVILVQDLGTGGGSATASNSAAKTLLSDVRVVAVGQSFQRAQGAASVQAPNGANGSPSAGFGANIQTAALPATLTLEMSETDAQRLYASLEVGKVELALRSLAHTESGEVIAEAISVAGVSGPHPSGQSPVTTAPQVAIAGGGNRPPTQPAARPTVESSIRILRGAAAPNS